MFQWKSENEKDMVKALQQHKQFLICKKCLIMARCTSLWHWKSTSYVHIDVYPCGLVINENNCWLGSSPDAKVLSGNEFGIVECNCTEQHKH